MTAREEWAEFVTKLYQSEDEAVREVGKIIATRNLRHVFDPYACEWGEDGIRGNHLDSKVEFLRKILVGGNIHLLHLVRMYKALWTEHGRPDIADAANDALTLLLEHILRGKDGKS